MRKIVANLLMIFAVFVKDFRSEIRNRYSINTLLMFVVTTLSIVIFSIGYDSASQEILVGMYWIIIFFASMSGLSRTFVNEEERGTVLTLQLLAAPTTIYFGKLFFNLILLFVLTLFTTLLYFTFISNFVIKNYAIFGLTIVLGIMGLASASTIIAAIISKANTRGTLYPVLSFPVLLPLILTVINTTRLASDGTALSNAFSEFRILLAYLLVVTTVSYILFDYIWRE